MNLHPVATREELGDAADDRPRVILRGGQLRRRRLALRAGGLAAAGVAATVISLTVFGHGSRPVQVVTSPPASTVLNNGGHWVFFRPVTCLIPAAAQGSGEGPPPSSVAAADADCSKPDASSVPDTSIATETASQPVVLPTVSGSVRYVLGPADLDTRAIAGAWAVPYDSGQAWSVEVSFTASGARTFDLIASQRHADYERNTANPPYASLEAFEVNGVVISAPSIQASQYNGIATFYGPASSPYSKLHADQIVQAIRNDLIHH